MLLDEIAIHLNYRGIFSPDIPVMSSTQSPS